ncbi:MAG: ABC transporter permease, partial [Candidatus Dormibacteria bacterium]
MRAVVLVALRRLAAGWRSWAALAMMIGVLGGIVLAVAAGARRTDSAYARFLVDYRASDVTVTSARSGAAAEIQFPVDAVSRLPEVADSAVAAFSPMSTTTASGRRLAFRSLSPLIPSDPRLGVTVDRFKLVEGRLADPQREDEAVIGFPARDQLGIEVGERLALRPVDPRQLGAAVARGVPDPDPVDYAPGAGIPVQVVGIVASPAPNDFPPLSSGNRGALYLTAAFGRRHRAEVVSFPGAMVTLKPGASLARFESEVQRIDPHASFQTGQDHIAAVQSSLHLEAQALALLAVLGAVALLLILAQALSRRVMLDAGDNAILAALGTTRSQLAALALVPPLAAGCIGALLAAATALLLSPLMPVGLARTAEPRPGLDADPAILLGVDAAILLLVPLLALPAAWRTSRAARHQPSEGSAGIASRLMEWMAGSRLPAPAAVGVRLALQPGRGRSAVPVRSTIAGGTLAVAALVAALVFSASLHDLLSTPRLYGWNWNTLLNQLLNPAAVPSRLAALPSLSAAAGGAEVRVVIGEAGNDAFAMDQLRGSLGPSVTEGRSPQSDDEILLGGRTMSGEAVGGAVPVRVGRVTRQMRLVGRGVLPTAGVTQNEHLGEGAWITYAGLHHLLGDRTPTMDTFLIAYGPDPAAARADLARAIGNSTYLPPPQPPPIDFGGVDTLPVFLAGVLAAAALATIIHT